MTLLNSTFRHCLIFFVFFAITHAQTESSWSPINFEISKAVGPMNWSAAVKIYAYMTKTDLAPSNGGPLVFVNRHVNPNSSLPQYPAITRNSPGMDVNPAGAHVSIAAMPGGQIYQSTDGKTAHQRDWDFIVQERDRILTQKGVINSTDVFAKIRALTDYVQSRVGGASYPSRHPTDYLLHSSYCTGAANAAAAILSTMGYKVRTINSSIHSTAEVEVNGKWHFIENASTTTFRQNQNVMNISLVDRDSSTYFYSHFDLNGDRWNWAGAVYDLVPMLWHFNQCGVGSQMKYNAQTIVNGSGVAVGLDCNTAKALYPTDANYYFRAVQSGALMIAGKYCWYYSWCNLNQGQKIRRKFYLGNVQDPTNPIKQMEFKFLLAQGQPRNFPVNGQGWVLRVNNRVYNLTAPGLMTWKVQKDVAPFSSWYSSNPAGISTLYEEYLDFKVPIDSLKSNTMNTVELSNETGTGSYLPLMMMPDPVSPYFAPLYFGSRAPQQQWKVLYDHICEVLDLDAFNYTPRDTLTVSYTPTHMKPAGRNSGKMTSHMTTSYDLAGRHVIIATAPFRKGSLEIAGLDGKLVARFDATNCDIFSWDTGKVTPGIYCIVLHADNRTDRQMINICPQ
jgi:hypothetical protein